MTESSYMSPSGSYGSTTKPVVIFSVPECKVRILTLTPHYEGHKNEKETLGSVSYIQIEDKKTIRHL